MSEIKTTPLHHLHQRLGATMAPFSGWDMPIQYMGILPEHAWTRAEASLFDTCHMGEFALRGPTAEQDLERLITQNIGSIAEGQCKYGFMCNEAGGVIDDLTCYRRGPEEFFLVVNAGTLDGDRAWIEQHLSAQTEFEDRSPGRAKLDVQGPRSREILEGLLRHAMPKLGYFRFVDAEILGVPMTVSRTGYTGEFGYEFYFDAEHAERVWQAFTRSGEIRPAGLGARDTLRLEMGYALYGHELNDATTPWGATRGMFIDLSKDFIGKAAVEADAAGPARVLVGLMLESKRAARDGAKVLAGGAEVGVVTSGSVGPSVGAAVAMAYVDAALSEEGTELELDVRGKALPAKVVGLPFYKEGSARRKKAS